jgi:magnesium transporter
MTDRPLNASTEALLRRLVRRDAGPAIRKVISSYRPGDIAAVMRHMTWAEQRRLYQMIDDRDQAAEVLTMLPEDAVRQLTADLTEEHVVDLVDRMELDDATDVLSVLPDAVRTRVLSELSEEDGSEVASLLEWAPDSAGGLMSPEFFSMPDTATCGSAIRALQKSDDDVAYVQYVYVTDREERLVGVVSLRTLVVRPPATPLISVMTRDPITVSPTQDQEEVARYVARYDLLSIPVVDEERHLLGIVTVDDVIDVIREEAAEDMYLMAGLSDDADPILGTVLQQTRQRGGWLLATIGGGICASEIIGTYEHTLAKVAVLAGFIPVIMGMAGTVGIQSATVAVRGLATGHVQLAGAVPFIWREVRVGVLLGLFYGLLLTLYGVLRYQDMPLIGAAVGASVTMAIGGASLFGAGIPVALSRLGIDPAIATGPIVTTIIDLVGIVVYFNVARWMLGL